jgi:hypothetical protein
LGSGDADTLSSFGAGPRGATGISRLQETLFTQPFPGNVAQDPSRRSIDGLACCVERRRINLGARRGLHDLACYVPFGALDSRPAWHGLRNLAIATMPNAAKVR